MKKSLKIILFITITISFIPKLQAQTYTLLKRIPISAKKIAVDKFDILYIIEDYKISQYNTKGELLYTYENLELGEISSLDVSNPLKLVVLFEDYNIACVLDHKMGLINTIDLFEMNLNQISAISIPNTMQFWVYDKIDTRLKLYDKNFKLINQSENFIQLFDDASEIKALKISNSQVYVLDKNDIKVFDQFGTFIKKIALTEIEDFQIFNYQIIYFQDNTMKSIHELNLEEKSILLTGIEINKKNALLMKNHIFIQSQKACYIYSIN